MPEIVKRQEAVGKKINCKDEFELCYLRHQYLRKSNLNPTDSEMKPYYKIIQKFSKRNYFMYSGLFKHVGFEIDDLVNICKVHLVSYLCLFSISLNTERKDKFFDTFFDLNDRYPNEDDILKKDKANFTIFLKQRFIDMIRIARQKVRNIRGVLSDEYLVYYGPKAPEPGMDLVKEHEKCGFRKLSYSIFKTIKNTVKDQQGPIYLIKDLFYVVVEVNHDRVHLHDLVGADIDPHQDLHHQNPEQLMIQADLETEFKKITKKWKLMEKEDRNSKLMDFIIAKSNDPRYTEEIKIAKRYIKE